ncbi:hypothetical protein Z043_113926, partial [Scleropages formosus]
MLEKSFAEVVQLSLPEDKRVSISAVTVGLSTVLSCAIQGTLRPPIIWKRNGIVLNFLDLEDINAVRSTGFVTSGLRAQIFRQKNQVPLPVPPVILVYPETQAQEPGMAASLHCYADGIPNPSIIWLKNGMDLQPRLSKQLSLIGAYTCIAKNDVGVDEDISSLFVEDSARKTRLSVGNMFYIFSDEGVTILQPNECEVRKHVKRSDRIVASYEEVCPKGEGDSPPKCTWASAVTVRDKYIYVTQPLQNRLLLVDTQAQKAVQVVETDPVPVKLHYDKSHDQVWVLSWGDLGKTHPTLQVVSQASVGEEHRVFRTQFQRVDDFFIPPTNLIITHVRFGFIFLKSETAVHKIDLETFHRVKTISLKNYSCVPAGMGYTHLSGYYFIHCQGRNSTLVPPQLIIDSVTDSVIGPNRDIVGRPYVSPDGRHVATPDYRSGLLRVQTVTFQGKLQLSHEFDLGLNISDLIFQPSFMESNQYSIVATSRSGTELLLANLSTGRREVLKTLKEPIPPESWSWNSANRLVVSSGLFGQFLVTPAAQSLFVLNGKQRSPHCELSDIKK